MEPFNSTVVPPNNSKSHFSDLPLGERVRVGAFFAAASIVLMLLTAIAVDCYHRWRGRVRARARDADEATRAAEVQLSAANLANSRTRTEELEQELPRRRQG